MSFRPRKFRSFLGFSLGIGMKAKILASIMNYNAQASNGADKT